MVAAPQSAAPQKASDAAPPAATLIEGFAAAAGTPVAAASLQAAGRKRRARKSAKFMPRGDLDTEAAGSGGLTQAVPALPPYEQRLTEPGARPCQACAACSALTANVTLYQQHCHQHGRHCAICKARRSERGIGRPSALEKF